MNARHLLFRTGRFNLSKVHEHFINPCCFGEDLAAWLRSRLAERDIHASEPGQEDWGWYLDVKHGNDLYYLCVGGNSDGGVNRDEGEWRIIVEKSRSIWDRMTGKGKITENDPMLDVVRKILQDQADFRDLRLETDG
ncbi:MAG TPA: hypothetical protein VN822_11760 [Candidatus Acidoferrales bacterium]|nr:hypothetical protein [Candidatus Acidoferrales bacterium]